MKLSNEQVKEIVKAKFYGFAPYQIAGIMDISVPDVLQVLKDNKDYLEELEGRNYENEGD